MTGSPLSLSVLFQIGPVAVTTPVAVTWGIMALLVGASYGLTRRLTLRPSPAQTVLELVVGAIEAQITDVTRADAQPYVALIGTLFLFILTANWSSLVPGLEPPTAHIETDAALALIVAVALLVCNTTGFQLFSVLLVQLISGLSGAFLAEICHNIEIQQFLDSKRTAALAAKNRALLYAFIPKSVVPRLVNTNDGEFICANISEVAIMFCKVKSYEELNRDFSLQTFRVFQDLFCKFDDAVQRFGMYKYQVQLPRLNIFCRCDVTVSPAAAASRGMVHCGLSARRQALRRGRRPQ